MKDGKKNHCRRFHFVHVGKNGGTAVAKWLKENYLDCLITPNSFQHKNMEKEPALGDGVKI